MPAPPTPDASGARTPHKSVQTPSCDDRLSQSKCHLLMTVVTVCPWHVTTVYPGRKTEYRQANHTCPIVEISQLPPQPLPVTKPPLSLISCCHVYGDPNWTYSNEKWWLVMTDDEWWWLIMTTMLTSRDRDRHPVQTSDSTGSRLRPECCRQKSVQLMMVVGERQMK